MFQPGIDWLSALILVGILQCLGLLYVLLTKPRWPAKVSLIGLFFSLLYLQVEAFFIQTGYLIYVPHLLNTSAPLLLVLGPFTWIYFRGLEKNSISGKSWLHFVPGVLYFAYSFFFFLLPEGYKVQVLMEELHGIPLAEEVVPPWSSDPWGVQGWVIVEGASLHLLFYGLLCWTYIGQRGTGKSKGKLFFLSSALSLSGIILLLSEGGVINGVNIYTTPLPDYLPKVFSSVLTYILSILMLKNGDYFGKAKAKYRKSGLQESLRQSKIKQLEQLFKDEKPYLQQSYSLAQLAKHLNLSPQITSQLINEGMQRRFFELIHDYRIKDAQRRLMSEPEVPKMEYLAYELGYGSKSAFYMAFKKSTGLTPRQYRKKYHS